LTKANPQAAKNKIVSFYGSNKQNVPIGALPNPALCKTYPPETKRELAMCLCHLYADVMQTRLWHPMWGTLELGEDNLFHLGDGLESITVVLVEIRRGRSLDQRLELGRRIVDICTEVLSVPKRTVLVEFTVHTGDEILREGEWANDWTPAEASGR
jgi:hypothetical protein